MQRLRRGFDPPLRANAPHDTHPVFTYSLAGQQGDYLYVRAHQANESGWAAISSPIFITGE